MDKSLLKRGWNKFESNQLYVLNETDKAIYFKVGEDSIFVKNDKGISISCTCKFCSLNENRLCTNKLAVISYLLTHCNKLNSSK